MNFRHLPELRWAAGYPFALVLMALVCVGLYGAFKRRGWL
jgi:magnesium transporter